MPGPPPKHPDQRARRNKPSMTQLPAEGRKGRAPKWPFDAQTSAEKALWSELWRYPQAVMWERHRAFREVAAYVRQSVRAENGDEKAAPESRQLADRLGLTPLALRRLEWEIVATEHAEVVPLTALPKLTAADLAS